MIVIECDSENKVNNSPNRKQYACMCVLNSWNQQNFLSLINTDCAIRKWESLIKKYFATIECVSECEQFFRSYWDNKRVTSKWNKCVRACVLQRSKPEVFQILNVGGQTLRLNLFDVYEFWLYGYNIQRVPQRDNWLWLFKIYLHMVGFRVTSV